MDLALWIYPWLFLAALAAGLIDSMAGGGGLIALPALLMAGFPVPLAFGTNKLQSLFGSTMAAVHYARHGVVDWRRCRQGVVLTFLGALLGAWTVQSMDASRLGLLIPWLLAVILIYTIFRPQIGQEKREPRMAAKAFWLVAGLGLGFYDGFFGPGTGMFWTIAFVLGLGQDFMAATGHTKVMNAASNLASLGVFILVGQVDWIAGGVMIMGQIVGARLGAGLVVKKGARFIRPVFLTMVTLTIARLAYVELTRVR
ncbi:MAG: TSUP family transporter [Opitutaceae bacterium]